LPSTSTRRDVGADGDLPVTELQVKGYIERLREEEMELEEIDAEIARLRAKYGTTPNTKTIIAMKDAEAGLVEPVTLDEIRARCNAIR